MNKSNVFDMPHSTCSEEGIIGQFVLQYIAQSTHDVFWAEVEFLLGTNASLRSILEKLKSFVAGGRIVMPHSIGYHNHEVFILGEYSSVPVIGGDIQGQQHYGVCCLVWTGSTLLRL